MTVPNDTLSEPGGATPDPAPPAATPSLSPTWPAISTAGASFYAWLLRPRVRLTVTGALLLFIGGVTATNSVWTLPLVIVGALMVAVAWIGHRLEGRFAVEWGEAGTRLAFNATIKTPQPTAGAPALAPASPVAPASPSPASGASASRPQLAGPTAEAIDGEAHTVEINVSELKALIAAAEADEGADPLPPLSADAAVRDIRIRRLADEGARPPRPAG